VPADTHPRAVRRFVIVALVLPAMLAVIGAGIQLALLPRMPETIAVHWSGGRPDGFAPAWTQPLATIGLGFGVAALIALTTLPGLRRGHGGVTYRLMGAAAAASSALLVVAFTSTFAMQAGEADAAAAPSVWAPLLGSLIAGAVVGIAAWLVQPADEGIRGETAAARALELGPSERAVWLRTVTIAPAAALGIAAAVAVLIVSAVFAWVAGAPLGAAWTLTVVAAVLLVAAATTLGFRVGVDESGLRVESVLGVPRFRVPLDQIRSAACVEIDPMGEFGGWGLRVSVDGRFGVVLRRGTAIEVTRRTGRRFVVTVDDAATGAALLEALVDRVRT
jgi:hypothetical protein